MVPFIWFMERDSSSISQMGEPLAGVPSKRKRRISADSRIRSFSSPEMRRASHQVPGMARAMRARVTHRVQVRMRTASASNSFSGAATSR